MTKTFFVTGIGTEIGKTMISAILVEKLKADYWKPIQSGDLDYSDSLKVQNLVSNTKSFFHPEAYRLTQPYSPHYSAELDKVEIDMEKINKPNTENHLIIEGAGGLMVPLNQHDLMIDLIKKLACPTILVSRNYLGSINHTLLSIEALKNRNIPIEGIIFNGEPNDSTEKIILKMSGLKSLGHVMPISEINKESILKAGSSINL